MVFSQRSRRNPMSRNWLAVASAEHVEIGRNGGFMQVCHGKATPLGRIQPADRIVYYSPNRTYTTIHAHRDKTRWRVSPAIGMVRKRKPDRAERGVGLKPFRREVAWHEAESMPIAILQ